MSPPTSGPTIAVFGRALETTVADRDGKVLRRTLTIRPAGTAASRTDAGRQVRVDAFGGLTEFTAIAAGGEVLRRVTVAGPCDREGEMAAMWRHLEEADPDMLGRRS
jgi:hypothetical protein